MHACMLSHFSHVRLCATLWTIAHKDPLSIGYSRHEYWSWAAMPSTRGSSQPRDRTWVFYVSCIGKQILYHQHHLRSPNFLLYPRHFAYYAISTLAWRIPWVEEPGGLQSMGSLRVRHDWEASLSLFTFMHWRTRWQPTPVFLPGESPGRGSLVGCPLWGRTESDTTEVVVWGQTLGSAQVPTDTTGGNKGRVPTSTACHHLCLPHNARWGWRLSSPPGQEMALHTTSVSLIAE